MKNWEKFEKEIKEIGIGDVAVHKKTHEVLRCSNISCGTCLFYVDDKLRCENNLTEWLYSEYKKHIALTDDERKLCELLGRGWIARTKGGFLFHYTTKPVKIELYWANGECNSCISDMFPQCKFDFIKWEDEEPWEVRV